MACPSEQLASLARLVHSLAVCRKNNIKLSESNRSKSADNYIMNSEERGIVLDIWALLDEIEELERHIPSGSRKPVAVGTAEG